jgi:hypothetical protein
MKYQILLAIIPIFFCLSSVLAVDIDSCLEIDVAGVYRFSQNITTNTTYCNSNVACIVINASSVTLNLNGHSLNNDGACYYGINVLARDSDPTIVFDNIQIYNGNILGFTSKGIKVNGINQSQINNLKIINYGAGDGIYLNQPFNMIDIYNNYIETGGYAIAGSGYYTSHIYNNNFQSFNGLYLNGFGFDIERNLFGNLSIISKINNGNFFTNNWIHSNTSTECTLGVNQINKAITCDFCSNSVISNNIIVSQEGIDVINDAEGVNITQNQYYSGISFSSIATFDSTTIDNTFCSNTITNFDFGGFDATNSLCYWRGTTENAKIYVVDQNSNTILTDCVTNCLPMNMCNSTNKVHINSTCGVDTIYSCEFGCINGVCSGSSTLIYPYTTTTVPLTAWNVSNNQPVVNQSDINEAGLNWVTPFFTPVFLVIIMELIISSIVAWISKQPVAFPITIFLLSLMFGYFGMMSLFITAISCIITALLTAFMFKSMTK